MLGGRMKTILVIPDCQVKQGVPLEHLRWMGKYIVDKRPDVIVQIGDFADMPSLSSYDVGKKSFEGRRYRADVDSVIHAQHVLLGSLFNLQKCQEKNKKKVYNPRMIMTLGNHDERINRAVNNDPKLYGVLSISDLQYEEFGWEVYPYLDVVSINGIAFSHFFPTGTAGRPASTANAQLTKQHMSCIAGHQQGLQIATGKRADGTLLTSVIAGSFYLHNEEYMGPQGNNHWRGALMLHNCENGGFDLNPLPMKYLKEKYN
jgi:hypothetical protein